MKIRFLMPVSLVAIGMLSGLSALAQADDLQLASGATAGYLDLKELQSPVSVLHVVAHPDDEDGAMLAYCARELGVRTMLFSLTRGEGGANLISSHFFDALGALRTLEHRKAADYYGIELFYSRAADYGYSKTLEEAMRQWDNGRPLLQDLVEVIRRERPTIILSRFAGDARDGHGHHQMAGVLSRHAVEAAADPQRFPEQLTRDLRPWQVKKFYVRAGSPWRPPQEADYTIALPTGKFDAVIGASPSQIARFGLGFQRSQGMSGHQGEAGPKFSYYRLLSMPDAQGGRGVGAAHAPNDAQPTEPVPQSDDTKQTREASLFDGLDTSWAALVTGQDDASRQVQGLLKRVDRALQNALAHWNPRYPQATTTSLLAVRELLTQCRVESSESLNEPLQRLSQQLDKSIVRSAGLHLEAWVTDSEANDVNFAIPGERLTCNVRITNQGTNAVRITRVAVAWHRGQQVLELPDQELQAGEAMSLSGMFKLPKKTPLTRPHWSRASITESIYQVATEGNQRAEPAYDIRVDAQVEMDASQVELSRTALIRRKDPELGNVRYRLAVVPEKSVRFAATNTIVQKGKTSLATNVVVRSNTKGRSKASLRLKVPSGWICRPEVVPLEFQREDEELAAVFQLTLPGDVEEQSYVVDAMVETTSGTFREGFETVTARDLPRMNVYHDAHQAIQIVDAKVLGKPNVGYVMGSGDEVAEALRPLGISPVMLSDSDLAKGDLSRYDVILVGVRAYAVREELRANNARLMQYVQQGGVMIVQYQTPEFDHNFGPYPYEMGRSPEEVSEETARVTLLQPTHPVFTNPNRIDDRDFQGWFEQRGSKFWKSWDARYVPLLECHDRAQPEQQGGQLITQYGDGVYVYSAYAWYRQLPQAVPGAYRLFANLLSIPETDLMRK